MTEKTYSTNEKAADIVGYRKGGIAINEPCEMGFHCPICKYEILDNKGNYDERLTWSEYNAFLWCAVCDKDYPSALCMPDIDMAIDIFLSSVKDAKKL